MNKARRKKIKNIIKMIENRNENAYSELEDVLYDEQDAFDNMPENLQSRMRGEESSEAIDLMEDAISSLDDEKYDDAIESLSYIY